MPAAPLKIITAVALMLAASSEVQASNKPLKLLSKEYQLHTSDEDKTLLKDTLKMAALLSCTAANPFEPESYKPLKFNLKEIRKAKSRDRVLFGASVTHSYIIALSSEINTTVIVLDNHVVLLSIRDVAEDFNPGDHVNVSVPFFLDNRENEGKEPVLVRAINMTNGKKFPWMIRAGIANKVSTITSVEAVADDSHTTYTLTLEDGSGWQISVKTESFILYNHAINPYSTLAEWTVGDSILIIKKDNGKDDYIMVNIDQSNALVSEAKSFFLAQ